MKGDEMVEVKEESANSLLLLSRRRQFENGIEEIVRSNVEQTMVPRTLGGNNLDGLVPAVRLIVCDEEVGGGVI